MKNNKKNITSLRSFKIKSLSKSINNHFGTYQKGIPPPPPPIPCGPGPLTNFSGQDFSGQDFSQQPNKFYCVNLEDATFENVILTNAKFSNSNLENVSFLDCSSNGVNFSAEDLENKTNLENATFGDVTLINANFSNSNLKNATFTNADLTGANLTGAILTGATFFKDTILDNVTLTGATLTNVTGVFDFANIILVGSLTVQYATTNLKNLTTFNVTNISKINLQGEVAVASKKTLIHAIYINGTKYGGNGGSDTDEISLAEGEYINEVTVGNYITNNNANLIGYLEFKTSKSPESQRIFAGNNGFTTQKITLKNIKVTEIGGAYNDNGVYNIKITFTKA